MSSTKNRLFLPTCSDVSRANGYQSYAYTSAAEAECPQLADSSQIAKRPRSSSLKPAAYCEQCDKRSEARGDAYEKIPSKDKIDDQCDSAGDQTLA